MFHAEMIDEFTTMQEMSPREIDADIMDSLKSPMIADERNACVSGLNSSTNSTMR